MTIIGIDLGTTHSLVAAWGEDGVVLIPNAHGEFLTPSVISLDKNGEILIGKAAEERKLTHPDRTVATFKRRMGTSAICTLAGKKFRPEELSALILKQLKEDAEHHLKQPVNRAVISVPAYFNDAQRNATTTAAELAGLQVERLINEPTAAAIAYGLHDKPSECHFLVVDLGGGTFDVSVLELFEGVMEVHATAGDNYLGGEDFTQAVLKAFLDEHDLIEKKLKATELSMLQGEVERAKKRLSTAESVAIAVTIADTRYEWELSRGRFDTIVEPLLERIRAPIERSLRDSRLRPADLDEIVMVGGATRMPCVRAMIAKMFRRFPACTLNPDEVVARGAAIQAALVNKHQALRDVVLTDVCPYTLGIEICVEKGGSTAFETGHFLPIIERNSTVPISRVKRINTVQDNQTRLKVQIYQGEQRLVKNNIFLGDLEIAVPGNKAGVESADVRLTYNVNGVLEVVVTITSTGETKRIVIENAPGSMSPAEIEDSLRKLADLKIHPRENAQNVAVLARAERIYEESLGHRRAYVADLAAQFEAVLDTQDPKLCEEAREQLTAALDQLDGESVFE